MVPKSLLQDLIYLPNLVMDSKSKATTNTISHTHSNNNINNNSDNSKNNHSNIHIVVPYTKKLSESLKNVCGKMGIQVHFKGGNTIRSLW